MLHLPQRLAQGGGDLVEAYQAVQEARLGYKLLEVGRHCGAGGQHHAVCHRGRGKAQPRQGAVDYGQPAAGIAKLRYLATEHPRGGGAAEQHLAAHQHARRHQRAQRRAATVHMLKHRDGLPLQVVLLRGDETGALVKRYLRLRRGEHAVNLFAVDADGSYAHRHPQLVQPSQDIVKAHRLPGVLLKTHYRQAAMLQYLLYERHRLAAIQSGRRSSRRCASWLHRW